MSSKIELLHKLRRAQSVDAGTGSLVADAAIGVGSRLAAGARKIFHKATGKKDARTYAENKKVVSDTVRGAVYNHVGKHIDKADEYLGKHLGKVPGVGKAFKVNEQHAHAVDDKVLDKIKNNHPLTEEDKHRVEFATKGHDTHRATEPIRKAGKIVVPIAATVALNQGAQALAGDKKMTEHDKQQTKVAVDKNVLLKTASFIRNLEQDKIALQIKLEDQEKTAHAQDLAIQLLKEGIIDIDQLDEKIAELKTSPERGQSLLEPATYTSFGTIKTASVESTNLIEEYLLSRGV
jgi:hypothetical protein